MGTTIQLRADFSQETMEARRNWNNRITIINPEFFIQWKYQDDDKIMTFSGKSMRFYYWQTCTIRRGKGSSSSEKRIDNRWKLRSSEKNKEMGIWKTYNSSYRIFITYRWNIYNNYSIKGWVWVIITKRTTIFSCCRGILHYNNPAHTPILDI